MEPHERLPIDASFASPDEYVNELLAFATTNLLFQQLCGGVHILDFCTAEPDLYTTLLPQEWRTWFSQTELPDILAFLLHDCKIDSNVPVSLEAYVKSIRRFRFRREVKSKRLDSLPKHIAVGMKPKKVHEVRHFAAYIGSLADQHHIDQLVDFGSGQNYLGRVLASPPYERQVLALENQQHNIVEAQVMDITAKLTEKTIVHRNKKAYRASRQEVSAQIVEEGCADSGALALQEQMQPSQRPKGKVRYVTTNIEDGCLKSALDPSSDQHSMVVSLHSCGNLVHHGLRALLLNESVRAIAMVGCCYNLLTERLGPPTYKIPCLRSTNARLDRVSASRDANGFPMSSLMTRYKHAGDTGIRLNITARMMACQAPRNWSEGDRAGFFTRHFYRALLQRILVDQCRGSQRPTVIIGSLRKTCYSSFLAYVRGAARKMADLSENGKIIAAGLRSLTDAQLLSYEAAFLAKKKELSIVWTLMAISAELVEAIIVLDRWLFLREQTLVESCWVEPVFEYALSPRNLVVVGIKK